MARISDIFRFLDAPVKRIDRGLAMAGILNGRRAYIGPEVLHLDLTNECNNNCIGCWCRSPLLGDKEMPEWEKHQTLPLGLIRGVIDDLAKLGGLRQVKLVGGGEPFMHPDILEIISYMKSKDASISIDINTNFTLVSEHIAEELVRLGVDSLTVSLWAGDPQTYVATHPSKKEGDFLRMGRVLSRLAAVKKDKPWVKIYNVISNLNFQRVKQMLDFGLDVKADDIQFTLLDPIPERTECLLLSPQQSRELSSSLSEIRENFDPQNLIFSEPVTGRRIMITDLGGVIRRNQDSQAATGIYDEKAVMSIPCYVGWLFARIIATGDVVPCCKGHRMNMGNIRQDRFRKIWHGRKYREFRYMGKNIDKAHPYFRKIGNDASHKTGCYNCDNLWQNEPMHKLIKSFHIPQPKRFFSFFNNGR